VAEQMQRLSGLDWHFLGIEDKSQTHMHIGSLLLFAEPVPTLAELREFIGTRIGLAPRFRQKLMEHPADGKPTWVDDPDFDLSNHVKGLGVPSPGGDRELNDVVGEVYSRRLDRSKPMWEMWFVEGVEGNRWGLILKMHHAMVDGLGAIDIFAALLDFGPVPREEDPGEFEPRPTPRRRDMMAASLRRGATNVTKATDELRSMIGNPSEAGPKIYDLAKGLVETSQQALPPPPSTILNVPTGPNRGFHGETHRFADYRAIRKALGGTINDVVLSVTADALGRYLRRHGTDTTGMQLQAEIPSAVRSEGSDNTAGNVFVVLAVKLPVDEMEPTERYAEIAERMKVVKESGIATAVTAVLEANNFLPPTILAQMSRLFFSRMLFNLLISNVPGVQFPVYLYGSELLRMSPLPWVGPEQALSVAVASYNGSMNVGLMVDRDVVRDVEVFGQDMNDALADLLAAAGTNG
jgi:diacylglycerol O-acyltransferase